MASLSSPFIPLHAVLGTGGIVYESLHLAMFVTDPQCASSRDGIHSASCVLFIVLQVTFILNYAKVGNIMLYTLLINIRIVNNLWRAT